MDHLLIYDSILRPHQGPAADFAPFHSVYISIPISMHGCVPRRDARAETRPTEIEAAPARCGAITSHGLLLLPKNAGRDRARRERARVMEVGGGGGGRENCVYNITVVVFVEEGGKDQ